MVEPAYVYLFVVADVVEIASSITSGNVFESEKND